MARKVFKIIFIFIFILALGGVGFVQAEESLTPNPAAAQVQEPKPEPKELTREKTLEGEIAGVSPNFIAIDYAQDDKTAYEMTFNISKDTRLERISNIKSLKPGDTVWVSYREKVLKTGNDVRVLERVLMVLRLLNSAKVVAEPVAEKIKETEESAPEKEETQQ
jgi:hypothetical protein